VTRSTLRIVLVAGEDPGWGAIGTYTGELARGLVAEGHDVELVLRGWEEDGVELLDGLTVHRVTVPPPSWRRGTVAMLSRAHVARETVLFSSRVAQVVWRLHRAGGVDVVEAPAFQAAGIAASLHSRAPGAIRRGPVVVARLHAPLCLAARLVGETSTADTRLLERLERAAIHDATIVTAPSNAMAAEVAARWGAAVRRRVQVVPNPIDAERFAPAPTRADSGALLIVGRIERDMGQDVAVEALPAIRSDIPGARLLLVGEDSELAGGGSALDALRRRVAALGMPEHALQATGAVAREELPAYLARANVCLVPSRSESFGYTCLQAMACGRPVVASATGVLDEIVSDGVDGLRTAPEDAPALAAAAISLLSDPQRCERLGHAARATVEQRFAAPVVARRVAALYTDAASAATMGRA
jgi:glycosyltransferase involved in cell wall biosynthesis